MTQPAARGYPGRPSRPRSLLLVLVLAKLLVLAPLASHATTGPLLADILGTGHAWADDGGEGEGGDGGEGEGGGDGGDGGGSGNGGGGSGESGFASSVGAFLSALRSHGAVAESRNAGGQLSVTYSDGWTEQVVGKTYKLLDRKNRTVVSRPVRASDRARLKAAIGQ